MDLEGTGTALSLVSEKSESSEDPSRRTKSRYELTKYQESVGLRVYVPRNSRSVHRFIRTVDSPSAIVGLPNVPWTSITDSTKTEELLPATAFSSTKERSAPEDTDRYPVT